MVSPSCGRKPRGRKARTHGTTKTPSSEHCSFISAKRVSRLSPAGLRTLRRTGLSAPGLQRLARSLTLGATLLRMDFLDRNKKLWSLVVQPHQVMLYSDQKTKSLTDTATFTMEQAAHVIHRSSLPYTPKLFSAKPTGTTGSPMHFAKRKLSQKAAKRSTSRRSASSPRSKRRSTS